jgi:hypothetical protein
MCGCVGGASRRIAGRTGGPREDLERRSCGHKSHECMKLLYTVSRRDEAGCRTGRHGRQCERTAREKMAAQQTSGQRDDLRPQSARKKLLYTVSRRGWVQRERPSLTRGGWQSERAAREKILLKPHLINRDRIAKTAIANRAKLHPKLSQAPLQERLSHKTRAEPRLARCKTKRVPENKTRPDTNLRLALPHCAAFALQLQEYR